MKNRTLYLLWGALYILCAGLGFIPEARGFGKGVLVVLALLFFLPGAVLLLRGIRRGDRQTVLRIRRLSGCWLLAVLVLMILNLLSVSGSRFLGNLLHGLLVLCSAPMFCGQFWWMSLFLWACLLVAGLLYAPRKAV